MTSKLLLAGGLVVAFVAGTWFQGYSQRGTAQAFEPAVQVAPVRTVRAPVQQFAPAPQPVVYATDSYPAVQRPVIYEEAPRAQGRSWEREVLIVAGSSGAGAAIGAVAGGKKGAAIGAISGGVAGLVYDMATRNK